MSSRRGAAPTRARLHATLLALALAAGLLAASSGALNSTYATTPGKNGKIAFKRYLDSGRTTGALFSVEASRKGEQRITRPAPGVVDDQPDWSPDGSLIVFNRIVPNSPYAVYTVEPDGANLTRVGPADEDSGGPSFLPDGNGIVYTRSTGGIRRFPNGTYWIEHSDIVVRDLSGNNVRVLVRSGAYEGDYLQPSFAPGGSGLVYVRSNSPLTKPAGAHALFFARADGSDQRRITPWSLDAGDNPDWSPNGRLIVFRSHEGGAKQSQIYVVRPDGSGLRPLTRFKPGTTVLSYSFSPDGKWITFAKSGSGGEPDIFVMRANGTRIRPITQTAHWDSAPDWGAR
jgi:Tol biopolymer transport system component